MPEIGLNPISGKMALTEILSAMKKLKQVHTPYSYLLSDLIEILLKCTDFHIITIFQVGVKNGVTGEVMVRIFLISNKIIFMFIDSNNRESTC